MSQAGGDEHSRCSPAKHYDIEVRHLVTPPSDGSDSLNHDSRAGTGDGVRHGWAHDLPRRSLVRTLNNKQNGY